MPVPFSIVASDVRYEDYLCSSYTANKSICIFWVNPLPVCRLALTPTAGKGFGRLALSLRRPQPRGLSPRPTYMPALVISWKN